MRRGFVATVITWLVFLPTVLASGAPLQVHAADALGLFLAFWVPALCVGGLADLKAKGPWLFASIMLGTFVWDYASAAAISKREVFDAHAAVYPLSVLVMGTLLSLHAWLVTRLSRLRT